ncbi:hypothetical protein CALVIDRAFT_567012 [Calocera viscosa TUFC12733]|uniref:Uncharacterized protein n=1 Tax=Calocera viscosa (strain TUFC12733) TaxID=1330018 RepID=A0A167ISD2_CALVF|nr:hypothetical protein CALVIDRAFT_567012 [Calocera viscosa TUFC12733]
MGGWPDYQLEESFWEGVKDLFERDKTLLFSRHTRLDVVEVRSRISISADALQSIAILEAARLPHLRYFTWGYLPAWDQYEEAPNAQKNWAKGAALHRFARAYQALGLPLTSITVYHPLRPNDKFYTEYMPEIVSDDFVESYATFTCLDNWVRF